MILKVWQIVQVVAWIAIRIGAKMFVSVTSTEYVQVFDLFILGHLLRCLVVNDTAVIQLKFDDVAISVLRTPTTSCCVLSI